MLKLLTIDRNFRSHSCLLEQKDRSIAFNQKAGSVEWLITLSYIANIVELRGKAPSKS